MEDLRYPIGPFVPKGAPLTPDERTDCIGRIAALPDELRTAVAGLTDEQLDTPYREGGWSPRQIAHHIADSHLNAVMRFKWGLTEDKPVIKTYDQERWATLADTGTCRVEPSLDLTGGLHERWVVLLRSLTPEDFGCALSHPEWGEIDLDVLLSLYAWHGQHHVRQITDLRRRLGW